MRLPCPRHFAARISLLVAVTLPAVMSFEPIARTLRNPGPNWGYALLCGIDRFLPEPLLTLLVGAGTGIAGLVLPKQRQQSREYLSTLFGRPARRREVWRHFYSYV